MLKFRPGSVDIASAQYSISMLPEETDYLRDNAEKFLERYLGKTILLKGSRLVGVFESDHAARKEGIRMFGVEPFLIRRVENNNFTEVTAA